MAEQVPNTTMAATAINPADNEKNNLFPDSSNSSTHIKGSDGAINIDPDSDVSDSKAPPGDQAEQVRQITGVKWVLVILSILSSTFLYALDNTVVADVEPKIVDRFGEIQKLPWLPIAFLVACVSTNLIWYRIAYFKFSNSH